MRISHSRYPVIGDIVELRVGRTESGRDVWPGTPAPRRVIRVDHTRQNFTINDLESEVVVAIASGDWRFYRTGTSPAVGERVFVFYENGWRPSSVYCLNGDGGFLVEFRFHGIGLRITRFQKDEGETWRFPDELIFNTSGTPTTQESKPHVRKVCLGDRLYVLRIATFAPTLVQVVTSRWDSFVAADEREVGFVRNLADWGRTWCWYLNAAFDSLHCGCDVDIRDPSTGDEVWRRVKVLWIDDAKRTFGFQWEGWYSQRSFDGIGRTWSHPLDLPAQPKPQPERKCPMQKLDRKFTGIITKHKDGSIVPQDEYMVFLAKDDVFPATLQFYRDECRHIGAEPAQLEAIDEAIKRVDAWRAANPDKCHVADVKHGELSG